MEYGFEFTATGPLEIEETYSDRAILNGTFLRLNSVTGNGREYQMEEGDSIATGLIGMPVFYGINPFTNKHRKTKEFEVGRVFKTLFDKVSGLIKGSIEVWKTDKFPDLINRIKKGWGFSIGGKAMDMRPTGLLNKLGRAVMKVVGMKPNHLQLIEPHVNRGQQEAQVEGEGDIQETIPVEESLMFDPCPWGICDLPEETIPNKQLDSVGIAGDKCLAGEFIPIIPEVIEETKRKVYILLDADSKFRDVKQED